MTSHAQNADAEALTTQAIALRRDHKNAEALELFRRAFQMAPGPRIRAHLGLAEQAVGQWTEAERDIRAALEARDDPWIVKNREALEQALEIVIGHLGWIEIQTTATLPDVWINGEQVIGYVSGDAVRVVAGTNVVEVRAPGQLPTMKTLLVLPNTKMRETFVLTPIPPNASRSALEAIGGASSETKKQAGPPLVESPARTSPVVYAALGLGGALLAAGAVTGVLSLSRASDAKDRCHNDSCPPEAKGDIDASRSLGHWSNAAFLVGGIGVAVGAIAWAWPHSHGATHSTSRAARATLEMAPLLGDRFVGVTGRF